jgi:hypothetical protein
MLIKLFDIFTVACQVFTIAAVPLSLHLTYEKNGTIDGWDYFLIFAFFVICIYVYIRILRDLMRQWDD